MLRVLAIALFSVCTSAQVAMAENIHVYGFGNKSCAAWTTAHAGPKTTETYAMENWVLGFITGAEDAYRTSVGDNGAAEGMIGYMTLYCSNHPLDYISGAGENLYKEMRGIKH